LTGNLNIGELEKCMAILKEYNIPTEVKTLFSGPVVSTWEDRTNTGETSVEEKISRPAVPEWSIIGTSHQSRKPLPAETTQHSPLFLIAVVVVIIIFVAGAFIVGPLIHAKNIPVNQSVTATEIVNNVVPSPSLTPTPQPQETNITTDLSDAMTLIPSNGVWVQVSYPGNYTGYLGAQGRKIEVNSSGTRFYQLPVDDAMIEGMIEKMDGSSEKLEVGIYNGGTLVFKSETTKPQGLVDIHVMVGPAIGNGGAVIMPLPTENKISPYASLPQTIIPPSGVWVRVVYPGNFLGSIGANGQMKNVNSTGDRFYQLPIASGMIDGSVEKQDGSVKNLIIEVYKDGVLISQSFTSTPRGVVDIHTEV
jgi:hypothetical protein